MSSTLLSEYSFSYVRSDQSNVRLINYANQQRKSGFFSDIELKAGNVSQSANRLLLACYSEYFHDIFINKLNKDDCLVVDGIDGESLKTLIDYIYEGTITINNENVFRLMSAARKLKLIDVVQFCCRFLESVITYDSCLYILDAAKLCQDIPLQMKAIQHIGKNLNTVSSTQEFKNLSNTDLIHCIRLLKHDQSSESMIYESIVRWVKHDEDQRRSDFHELFQLIKLDRIPHKYLTDVVLEENLVSQTATCLKLVSKRVLKVGKQDVSESTIVSLGGKGKSKMNEIFSLTSYPSKKYPDLPEQVQSHSSLKLNNYVYCIAGANTLTRKTTNKVWRLNLNEKVLKWKQIPSLPDNRHVMGAAVYCNTLVVSHGYGDKTGTTSKTNLIYEESSNQWKPISPLQQIRESHQLAVCHGKLFAIGGCSDAGKRVLSSVEQLSDLSSRWKYVNSLLTPRKWFAAVTCSGYIYAIGGCSGTTSRTVLKSVERYDPVLKKWEYVSDMNSKRIGHSACAFQKKIYVVGGCDSNDALVKKGEYYDPIKGKWFIAEEINEEMVHGSLAVF